MVSWSASSPVVWLRSPTCLLNLILGQLPLHIYGFECDLNCLQRQLRILLLDRRFPRLDMEPLLLDQLLSKFPLLGEVFQSLSCFFMCPWLSSGAEDLDGTLRGLEAGHQQARASKRR